MKINTRNKIKSKFTDFYGVIICFYVDDILIFGKNMKGIFETKKYLTSRFKMKDRKEIDTILGIKVKKYNRGYVLCQSHYVEKLLKFQHLGIKEVSIPYDSIVKLTENFERAVAQLKYASAIGSLPDLPRLD